MVPDKGYIYNRPTTVTRVKQMIKDKYNTKLSSIRHLTSIVVDIFKVYLYTITSEIVVGCNPQLILKLMQACLLMA